jgi:hypothetical protein
MRRSRDSRQSCRLAYLASIQALLYGNQPPNHLGAGFTKHFSLHNLVVLAQVAFHGASPKLHPLSIQPELQRFVKLDSIPQ